jgi:hypothetical protein
MIGWWFLLELRNGKAGSFRYYFILFPRMNPGVNIKRFLVIGVFNSQSTIKPNLAYHSNIFGRIVLSHTTESESWKLSLL